MTEYHVLSTTIPANERSSGVIDLGGHSLVAIEIPDAFNGTVLNFQSKPKATEDITNSGGIQLANEDWDDVYDSGGTQIAWTVAAGRVVVPTAAHAAAMAPLRFLRIVAATGQNPARELRLIVKEG